MQSGVTVAPRTHAPKEMVRLYPLAINKMKKIKFVKKDFVKKSFKYPEAQIQTRPAGAEVEQPPAKQEKKSIIFVVGNCSHIKVYDKERKKKEDKNIIIKENE